MWRFTDRMVRSTLVTACRLATSPTRTSPDLANATTDGVVREPSALGMTVGSPPSSTATTLFVVPRSMPTARAMSGYLRVVRPDHPTGLQWACGCDAILAVSTTLTKFLSRIDSTCHCPNGADRSGCSRSGPLIFRVVRSAWGYSPTSSGRPEDVQLRFPGVEGVAAGGRAVVGVPGAD